MKSSKYTRARDASFYLSKALCPQGRKAASEDAKTFKEDRRRIRELFSDSNLLGFGVTEKIADGASQPGEFCLTFYVRRKLPKSKVPSNLRIPKLHKIHTLGRSIRTDVQALGNMHVAHSGISAGGSVGHISGTAGTVTFVARDTATGKPRILGCSHVLARAGAAHAGDAIESPGYSGIGVAQTTVGYLTDKFLVIDPSVYNSIDAALATPAPGIDLSNNVPGVGPIAGILDPTQLPPEQLMALSVEKFGAQTGLNAGHITGMHTTLQIRFPELGDRVVWFTDLLTHDVTSEEGDSGAALLDSTTRKVLGMHIAGSGQSGCCTNIQPILCALGIQLAL
ncbi:MAG: S1 family peptidase [Acidobacteriia bacterium]|nr:S1 family peptidase [Terriglobia bacterium]